MQYEWLNKAVRNAGSVPLQDILHRDGISLDVALFEERTEHQINIGLKTLGALTRQTPVVLHNEDFHSGEREYTVYSAQRAEILQEEYRDLVGKKLAQEGVLIPKRITDAGIHDNHKLDEILASFAASAGQPVVVVQQTVIGNKSEQKQYVVYTQERAMKMLGESNVTSCFAEERQIENMFIHTLSAGTPRESDTSAVKRKHKLYEF